MNAKEISRASTTTRTLGSTAMSLWSQRITGSIGQDKACTDVFYVNVADFSGFDVAVGEESVHFCVIHMTEAHVAFIPAINIRIS
jgi:hypothetical protein